MPSVLKIGKEKFATELQKELELSWYANKKDDEKNVEKATMKESTRLYLARPLY